ncbi:expansin EXLX1 family cellulose-binding protein [Xanthomonas sp. WHRI 8391]|uniref:expansin EXLX1 family cellulose-binding protein n=1 Tax=Xanthomonas TaxID=338 RepID=UPI001A2E4DAC|nr:expansin EXLX1 family cellulose-binding protein [Xanthomonas hortorum]MBG3850909.1 cellulase family glycosylhydrolase [Xanthomonas hortorum pv. carotae]UTS73692.1 cellulase family glycosylhydrolase [Xanthomonas hortorum]
MYSRSHLLLAMTLLAPVSALAVQVDAHGQLIDARGQALQLRGVTWPGFDRASLVAAGLRNSTLQQTLDQMQAADINALRVPICTATLQAKPVAAADIAGDPALRDLTSLQLLDAVVRASTQRGMQVLLAFADGGCDDSAPQLGAQQQAWTNGLTTLAARYGTTTGVIGIDLGSSGYRNANWAGNSADADWNRIASRTAGTVLKQAPRWVVGVEGVGNNALCSDSARKAPGSNLQPLACVPLRIPAKQLVLMPKLAGPDRDAADTFAAADFPRGLPASWQRDFGTFAADHAVLPVSIGGGLGDGDPRDPAWQQALSGYLTNTGMHSAFLGSWEIGNANNGGLLASDGSPRSDKLQILHQAWGLATATSASASTKSARAADASKAITWNSTFSGTATYTGSGYSGGAVLLDPIPSNAFITALNPTQMNFGGVKAALAGAYLEVTGPKGKTVVYVTDLYPDGASGGLDLSPNAFSAIGDMVQGRIPISWKIVRAPITGNVQYRIKEGSSRWWAAIQVRNHAYPVVKFEVKQGSTWKSLQKMDYNHFLGEQLGNQPLSIRITDIRGKAILDTIPALPEDGNKPVYFEPGNVQFP